MENPNAEGESLESANGAAPDNAAPATDATSPEAPATPAAAPEAPKPKAGPLGLLKRLATHLNIYLLIFILLVVLSAGVVVVGFKRAKNEATQTTIESQKLSQEQIDALKNTDAKVGDPKQVLNVESNAVFAGKVLIRDSLDVAGGIKIGGALSLPGLSVAGTSTFDQIQANKLSLTGDGSIQGQLTVQKTLSVNGGATFGGPISAPLIIAQSLQFSNDLQFSKHIDAGGATPGKSDGSALGIGGTSSVSGTDTAGTVTINTGGNPPVGCFVTITFTQKFNSTPHVVITPVGSGGASLNYYINRSTTNFTICSANSAAAGQNFAFDYIVID
jgi:cytoskeletal protein CcmA (bactofilin family)